LVISSSFSSQLFAFTCGFFNFSNSPIGADSVQEINFNFNGYIYWQGALIIWGISTFSQKYPRRKPTIFDFFYCMAGIYLFYLGISSGLQLRVLSSISQLSKWFVIQLICIDLSWFSFWLKNCASGTRFSKSKLKETSFSEFQHNIRISYNIN
jgi:hypothetical protein